MFTNITFFMTSPADAAVTVYDGGGDVVWKGSVPAANIVVGQNVVKWDGKNSNGKSVANGTYFYVLKTGGIAGKNKIVVMH
jgi:flagellar hook assembly protein FlgD